MTYSTVAELLADPARWCQHEIACRENGYACPVEDPKAVRWCLVGALERVYGRAETVRLMPRIVAAIPGSGFMATFNDTHTHAEVLELVRRAGV